VDVAGGDLRQAARARQRRVACDPDAIARAGEELDGDPCAAGEGGGDPARGSERLAVAGIADEELPGYEIIAWFALVAPARLPEAIVQRLHEANMKALASPEIKEKFALLGTDVAPMAPAELAKFIQAEVANWAKLVKLAGIQPE